MSKKVTKTKKVAVKKTAVKKVAAKKKKAPLTEAQRIEAGKIPFMIGSDPEYLLFYGNRGLDASKMIAKFFTGSNYSRTGAGYKIEGSGDFGWDGASSTGELRPNAEKNIHTHISHIEKMLSTINAKMPFVDISTLSIGAPIGGHIHLDSFVHKDRNLYSSSRGASPEGNKIIKRTTKLMSTFLLPVVASDHRISAMARLQGSYGKLNDIRYDQKGDNYTAEVRGLTAEWLTTPEIAYATMAYLTVVWHEIAKNHDELIKNPNILRTQGHCDSVHRLLISDYNLVTEALTKEIRKSVKTFELYPKFQKEVDFILNPKKVYEAKEKVGWNINKGWGFNKNLPRITKKSLLSDETVQRVLAKEDIPNIERSFAVDYNDDYNVSMFAKAISDRVATMNWQLKHNYALFGFKKGVAGLTAINSAKKYYCVSSNQSKDKTDYTAQVMLSRYDQSSKYGASRINPKTGRTQGKDQDTIVIGLPYEARAKNDVKDMISLIWQIEKGQLTPKALADFTVDEGTVGKDEQPDFTQILEDSGRSNAGSLDDAIETLINEENNN